MLLSSKGKHRRPSKAARVATLAGVTGAAVAAPLMGATATPPPPPPPSGTPSPSASPAATGPSTPATATTAACSSRRPPGPRTAARSTPPRADLASKAQQIADRREGPRRPGQGCLAGLRHRPVRRLDQRRCRPGSVGTGRPRASRAGAARAQPSSHQAHRAARRPLDRSAERARRPSRPRPARRSRRATASTRSSSRRHPQQDRRDARRQGRLGEAVQAEQGHRRGRRPDLPGPAAPPELTARRSAPASRSGAPIRAPSTSHGLRARRPLPTGPRLRCVFPRTHRGGAFSCPVPPAVCRAILCSVRKRVLGLFRPSEVGAVGWPIARSRLGS